MTEADKTPGMVAGKCPVCGVDLRPGDDRCWLCGAIVEGGTAPIVRPYRVPTEHTGGFSLASLMMFVTLVSVVFGLSTIVPGIGIPLGVVLLVAWGRTVTVTRSLASTGQTLTSPQKIQTYFSSLGFVLGLLLMVTVGVCVALGSICFGLVSAIGLSGGSPMIQIGTVAACVAGLFAALGLIRWAVRLNDYNWRRTMGENRKTPNDRKIR